ncbi:MAG: right-handed parallel beta-helix repeat-containing protein [Candidatus Thorarchaeota archaeon]
MLMREHRVMLGFILCFMVASTLVPYTAEFPTDNIERTANSDIAWSDNEMLIISDQELEVSEFPGNGSSVNPFVIANQTIDVYRNNIEIRNTNHHLLITNCTLSGYIEEGRGIVLNNVSNIVISNCSISSKRWGIDISYSENIHIGDCYFEAVYTEALYITHSSNIFVSHSTFHSIGQILMVTPTGGQPLETKIGWLGTFSYCDNTTLADNTGTDLVDAFGGFNIYNCQKIAFRYNIISDIDSALVIQSCSDFELVGNEFGKTSVYLSSYFGSMFSQVSSNMMDGKDLGILVNSTNLEIDGNSMASALLIDCTNISIIGGEFEKVNPPIGFWDCTSCTIQDVAIFNSARIVNSLNCSISSITSTGGITIVNSEGTKIVDSSFLNTTDSAINLENSTRTFCENDTIYNCRGGISVQYSDYTDITDNWIELSGDSGIQIGASRHGIITGNVILGSTNYGIILEGGAGRFDIYNNVLGWNRVENAVDDGSSNFWDDEISRGNNYSDYHGAAVYTISGEAGSVDNYPSGITDGFWFPPWRNAETEQQIMIIMIIGIFSAAVFVSVYIWKKYLAISKPL